MDVEHTEASLPYGIVHDPELGGWVLVRVEGLRLVDPPFLYPTREGAMAGAEAQAREDREEEAARRRFADELARLRERD
jgi:hypothetical protein